jgi:hypothetical protein
VTNLSLAIGLSPLQLPPSRSILCRCISVDRSEYVYTEYVDPRRDEWQTKILPALQKIPPEILQQSGLSRRMIMYTLAGKRPHRKNQQRLAGIARKLGVV